MRRSTWPDQVVPGAMTTLVCPQGVETFTTNGMGVSFRIVASIVFPAGAAHPERAKTAARNIFIQQKYSPNIGRGDRCRTGVSSLAKRRTTVVLHPEIFLVAREGIEPSPTRFKGGAPIPVQSAGQWWELEELNLSSLTAAFIFGQRFYRPPSGPAPWKIGGSGGLCSRCLLLARQALS